jgi:glutathione S-transferase
MRFTHNSYHDNALDAPRENTHALAQEAAMKLYFSPLACSLASRIALYEANAEATFVEVDLRAKTTTDGQNYLRLSPLGQVPLLELEPGETLSENGAILQFIAERYPEAGLAPRDAWGRSRLQEWLSFIGSELHKALFYPLLDENACEGAKAYALEKAASRFGWLQARLAGREFLLERFSVADAYLFAVLNWSAVTPVNLATWPTIRAYHASLLQRPSVSRAFSEERERYLQKLARAAL